jgi:UDP-2-acetamido-2,6-beta-L-arabino-hexul-4-ose reductase
MWVGDLAVLIRERLSASVPSEEVESRFHYTSKICVGRLSELIHQLGDNIRDGISDVTERSFRWKLETTLLSFFEPNLSRSLHPHCDHRGVFVELLKTQSGQISVLECEVNKERGLHFHLAKYERFFVVKGKALFRAQHVSGGDIYEKEVCSPEYTEVFTSPLYVHSIKNIGEDTLIVVIWSNENFRPDNPDTVFARFK